MPLRLAALLHDIGKPATRRLEPGGGVTFYHHDIKGARLARKRLQALRFDSDTIAVVTRLIELHLRFFGYAEGAWTDSAVRRYVRDADAELDRLHILTRADVTTRNVKKAARLARAYDDIERRIAELAAQEELDAMRPELDGNRIQEVLGIPPGREVGEAYRFLLDLRLDEGVIGAGCRGAAPAGVVGRALLSRRPSDSGSQAAGGTSAGDRAQVPGHALGEGRAAAAARRRRGRPRAARRRAASSPRARRRRRRRP